MQVQGKGWLRLRCKGEAAEYDLVPHKKIQYLSEVFLYKGVQMQGKVDVQW